MFGYGFNAAKLKPQLKMAGSRIQIASNKKAALLKQSLRDIALLLAEDPPREEKAKIKAEALIRDDNLIEAYEILQLECDLLFERIKLIESTKECPPDLVPVVSTLIWASNRVDIPELVMIRKQFRAKYGKTFEERALENTGGILNERVVTKLSVEPPPAYHVQSYLERICEQYEVSWTPKVRLTAESAMEPMAAPVGYSVAVAQGTGLGDVAYAADGTATTTQVDTDEFLKQSGGIPPPVIAAEALAPNGGGSAPTATSAKTSDFEEPDIYVPGAAPAPDAASKTAGGSSSMGEEKKTANEKSDDDSDAPAPGGQSGGVSKSYADLAARFDQLKK